MHTFLERLGELKLAYDVSDESMLRAVPELLKGQAILWFLNNQSSWNTWEEFLTSFKDRYLPVDIDDVLTEEIRLRTQGADESVADYVTAIRALMRRRTKEPTPAEQLRVLMKNLRPEVRLYIRDCDVNSVAKLLTMGKQYEQFKREKERFRPPPDIAQALIPEVAYRSRKSGTGKKLTLLDSTSKADLKRKDKLEEGQDFTSRSSGTNTCWNCNKPGHFFSQCMQSKRIFCHICGRPDTIATTCGCRKPRTTGLNRGQQDGAASSPQRVGTQSRQTREYHRRDRGVTGMRTIHVPSEHRCYVQLSVYDYPLLGLVETGADKSYIGRRAFRLCQSLDIPVNNFATPEYVQLADQSTTKVIGSVEIPIHLQGRTHLITCLILPNLCVDVVVGLDSLYRLGLVLNPAERTWHYQSCPGELFSVCGERCRRVCSGNRERCRGYRCQSNRVI